MKKILFYTLLTAVAFTTVSCDEDFNEDVAAPQTWPQEEAITLPGFSAASTASVDLASGDSVAVFTYTAPSNLPEGTTVDNFRLEITPDGVEGAKATTVKASSNGKVASVDLQKIIEDNYGKRPVERTLNANLYANLMKEGQASLLTCEPIAIKATPEAPHIASKYYMVGDMFKVDDVNNGWNAATMKAFNHSDKDVYEDPIFTLMITTTADNQYWKIIPQDNIDNDDFWAVGVLGVAIDGDDSMSGSLINTGDVKAAKIAKAGMYSITLNMMDYTYAIKEVIPEYYIVGAMQNWNADASKGKTCMLYPQSKMVHSYTTQFKDDANLKLWLGSDFGNWDACYGAAVDGDNAASGTLVGIGAGAAVCPEKGAFYTFTADFSTMTYKWTKLENQEPKIYTTISLIGAFNGWDQKTNIDLKEVTPHNWYGSAVTLAEGQLKFCANDDWADSWGGTGNDGDVNVADQNSGKTVYNGKNMFAPAGTYNVYFNDITGEYVFQVVE
ncbi:DUF5115 domain-containing protein [Bacteroides fluxus]|uniref:DUF5115 domain-containing protein n=1 Tax=Bacteroides fluxus TaxID=626930 RepID=UPI0023F03E70|nr:DUF5115 domain-containing protein [Bacteroides fluxus]